MPARDGLRPLKAWRYIGFFAPELMGCVACVRIGPARQEFWAVWDRGRGQLLEQTRLRPRAVQLRHGFARVLDGSVRIEITLEENEGVECICPSGRSYAWTRKQAGVAARAVLDVDGATRVIDGRAVIDDTAAYYPRHTRWRWSAGVGMAEDGRTLAWNLVSGVNDPPRNSERTVWIDGQPSEVGPCVFADDLSRVGELRFSAEAMRERRDNFLLVRSSYTQPFGAFSGELPGGIALRDGYGVMESHDVRW